MIDLSGKIAALTGADRGIGLATARLLSQAGAKVYASCLEVPDHDEKDIVFDVVNLLENGAPKEWITTIEERTGDAIDVLVNNAGGVVGQKSRPVDEVTLEEWRVIVSLNLEAIFQTCQAAAPAMRQAKSGRIINVSSGAGLRASRTGVQAYTAAKHGVVGLTRQLAIELGAYGITVNSVAPGFIRSNPDSEAIWNEWSPAQQENLINSIGLRRLGKPEDIANAILFFASDLAAFVNGEILSVNGGR